MDKERPPLIQCIAAGEEVDLSLTVRDAITVAGEWNVTYLQNFLTEDILSTIRAMPPTMDSMGQDTLTWELTNDGEFAVSSAYSALAQHEEEQDQVWTLIWRWKGPHRIKVFLWMVVHKKILTAKRRARMFQKNPSCHKCDSVKESVLHVLRDCPWTSRVWTKLIHPSDIYLFFKAPFDSWIRWNMTIC
ncbi:Putative ribonuclease H protein [Arachis hypogaea]|nr:Putative ribonuclease H protein [Arachis hypogaea]